MTIRGGEQLVTTSTAVTKPCLCKMGGGLQCADFQRFLNVNSSRSVTKGALHRCSVNVHSKQKSREHAYIRQGNSCCAVPPPRTNSDARISTAAAATNKAAAATATAVPAYDREAGAPRKHCGTRRYMNVCGVLNNASIVSSHGLAICADSIVVWRFVSTSRRGIFDRLCHCHLDSGFFLLLSS